MLKLDCEESWAPKNWCFWTVVLEKTLASPLDCKEIQPVHSEDQPWDFFGGNDAEAETSVLWPPHAKNWLIGKDWCWEGLGARGEGDDRGCDGWMASLTRWTWVWVNSGSLWWTGKPGMLRFMGSQRVGHDWATELDWTELMGPDAKILVFWMLNFKPTFSLSSFTLINRLFSSFSLSAIRVVSSAYLRLLIFLLTILIPAVLLPAQHCSWCTLHLS